MTTFTHFTIINIDDLYIVYCQICRKHLCPSTMGKSKNLRDQGRKRGQNEGKKVEHTTKPSSDVAPSIIRTTLVLFVISLLGVLCYLWLVTNSNPSLPRFNVTNSVQVKILPSPGSKFARSCAESGVPVILKNSIASQWKASQWTPSYLERKIDMISGVYENSNRWFGPYFDKRKPLLSSAERINKYRTDVKLSSQEFFSRIQSDSSKRSTYLYFTGDIDQLGEWAIAEIEPYEELLTLNPSHSSINAWIGQPNVIAHCHYDGYHNFYAQLYGKKRFILIRPTNWPGLYPYPFLHPSHAQAQVNASSWKERSTYPLVSRVEVYEAVLEPGDLLYIPPLWFHEVESLEVSISVNVWTDSAQTGIAEKLFQLPLPVLTTEWSSGRAKQIATSYLIFLTLQNICTHQNCARAKTDKFKDALFEDSALGDTGVVYFVHRLWTTRYRTLMEKEQLPNSLPQTFGSSILCEGGWKGTDVEVGEAKAAAHTSKFGEYAQSAGILVRELPEDSWELWVGNFVEFVVANAMPSVEYVGVFLKHFSSCLLTK